MHGDTTYDEKLYVVLKESLQKRVVSSPCRELLNLEPHLQTSVRDDARPQARPALASRRCTIVRLELTFAPQVTLQLVLETNNCLSDLCARGILDSAQRVVHRALEHLSTLILNRAEFG